MSSPERSQRVAFGIVATACIAASVWHAHTIAYAPDGLPTWDPAGYLLEAVKIHASLVSGDAWGVLKGLTKPDLHPPLHSALLAFWLAIAGNTMAAARLYPVLCFVASLGLVVWMGHRALPRRGLEVGLVAALLTALGRGNLELLSSPMTESTGLLTQLLALGLAVHWADRRDARVQLGIGAAVLAATLVRFNMAPMLLAPLYVHHAWRFRRDREALLDPRVLLWAVPTLVGFGLWQLTRPDLYDYVVKFFENRSSGLDFWSAESLLFVPLSTHRGYLPYVGVALFVPFLVGLVPRVGAAATAADPAAGAPTASAPSGAGLGRLQAYVLIGFAALTWHDFKIARNLATVLPVFYLCAVAPLAALRFAKAPLVAFAGLLALGGGYGVWQHKVTLDGLAARTDFQPDPIAFEALQFIEKHAREREQAWVTGWVFRLSPNLIDYWLRVNGVPAKLRLDQQLFGVQSRTGVEAPWTEEYATWTAETVLAPEHRDRTTYITIETVPGTKYFDQWKAFGNHYARAFAEQKLVPEVDRVEFVDAGLTIRVYRANGTPSAASLAARDAGPTPEDEVGVRLPADATPLFRETFHAKARKWMAYPATATGAVELVREGSALEIRVKEAQKSLQVCNSVEATPAATFTAIVNASTTGMSGKAFLHFRGMGADDTLQKLPDGAFDITHAGPLVAGANVLQKPVALGPTSPKLRVCIMLDGLAGTVRMEDIALYPEGTVLALQDAPGTSGAAAGGTPANTPAPAGWRLYPPDAAGAVLRTVGSTLEVEVTEARPQLQACGPTVPWTPPMNGAVRAHANVASGKAFVHLRALDADAVLLQDPEGRGRIEHFGPLTGPAAAVAETRPLPFPEGTALVRPCVVLDGVVGKVSVDGIAITPGS
ncbi:MAG: glycosyltransferase family 39 protein [Pseudomonadota bacterium]|nr:glycosyltransferase family 39 protein [Pseudomonadota bacterium]